MQSEDLSRALDDSMWDPPDDALVVLPNEPSSPQSTPTRAGRKGTISTLNSTRDDSAASASAASDLASEIFFPAREPSPEALSSLGSTGSRAFGTVCVLAPSGKKICSVPTTGEEIMVRDLKRCIEMAEGTATCRQELTQGRILRDDERIVLHDGSAIVTMRRMAEEALECIPRAADLGQNQPLTRTLTSRSVKILAGSGRAMRIDEAAGTIVPTALAEEATNFLLVEMSEGEFTFQAHDGSLAGQFLSCRCATPFSPKSRLGLSAEPEAWILAAKPARHFCSDWLHRCPTAVGVSSKRRWGGAGGLFWNDEGHFFNLAQRAGDDFGLEQAFCILGPDGQPLELP